MRQFAKFALLPLLAVAAPSQAVIVEYDYELSVDTLIDTGSFLPGFSLGQTIAGTFSYDTDEVVAPFDTFTVTFPLPAGIPAPVAGPLGLPVLQQFNHIAGIDRMTLVTEVVPPEDEPVYFEIAFDGAFAFGATPSMPLTSPQAVDVGDFLTGQWYITGLDNDFNTLYDMGGAATLLEASGDTPVPAPLTPMLGLLALAGVVGRRWSGRLFRPSAPTERPGLALLP